VTFLFWSDIARFVEYNERMQRFFSIFKQWLPLGIVITALSLCVFIATQQVLRFLANDPQVSLSESFVTFGDREFSLALQSANTIEISQSLLPFVMLFDESEKLTTSTALLDGQYVSIPKGVLDYAKVHGQDRVTWQPKTGVRIALVVTHGKYGFAAVGRSLSEVERFTDILLKDVAIGWAMTMLVSFAAVYVLSEKEKSKKKSH
jgi:hypothetical protein